jgi:hypothetical protein
MSPKNVLDDGHCESVLWAQKTLAEREQATEKSIHFPFFQFHFFSNWKRHIVLNFRRVAPSDAREVVTAEK